MRFVIKNDAPADEVAKIINDVYADRPGVSEAFASGDYATVKTLLSGFAHAFPGGWVSEESPRVPEVTPVMILDAFQAMEVGFGSSSPQVERLRRTVTQFACGPVLQNWLYFQLERARVAA